MENLEPVAEINIFDEIESVTDLEQGKNTTPEFLQNDTMLNQIDNISKSNFIDNNAQINLAGPNMGNLESVTEINIFDEIESGSNEKVISEIENMFDENKKDNTKDSKSDGIGYSIFEEIENPKNVKKATSNSVSEIEQSNENLENND